MVERFWWSLHNKEFVCRTWKTYSRVRVNCLVSKLFSSDRQYRISPKTVSCLPLPPYEIRLKLIDLPTLEVGDVDSTFLLSQFISNASSRFSRHYVSIRLPQYRTNDELFLPFHVACENLNDFIRTLCFQIR